MRILVGDDIGLVKQVDLDDQSTAYMCKTSGAGLAVLRMEWLNPQATKVVICRENGAIEIHELSDSIEWKCVKTIDLDDAVVVLKVIDAEMVALTEETIIRVSLVDYSVVQQQLPDGPYSCFAFGNSSIIAARGSDPPVKISLVTNEKIWSGKHASDTSLALHAKFETRSLVCLSENVFVGGDASGKLRFYDSAGQRKPVYELPVYQMFTLTNNYTGTSGMGITRPISHLAVVANTLFLGDTYGSVIGIDLRKALAGPKLPIAEGKLGSKSHIDFCRKLFPLACSLKGIMGSVRDLKLSDTHAFVVSAGRFAYAFDLKSKKSTKVFLKQKLTCCLEMPQEANILRQDAENVPEDEEPSENEELVSDIVDGLTKSKRRRMRKGCTKEN